MSKPDAQIIEETEAIARILLRDCVGTGYVTPDGYVLREHRGNPRVAKAWNAAARIMDEVFQADVETALANEGHIRS
jgi:hypothetical protein